jgi:hypothetical protein
MEIVSQQNEYTKGLEDRIDVLEELNKALRSTRDSLQKANSELTRRIDLELEKAGL